MLASAGDDGTARLWDPVTCDLVGKPLPHGGRVVAVAFGVDGHGRRLLAIAGGGTVRLWDPATCDPVGDPLQHPPHVYAVAFVVDAGGRSLLASGGSDKTVRLWDPATGALVATLSRRTVPLALAAQGAQLAIGDHDGVTLVEIASRAL